MTCRFFALAPLALGAISLPAFAQEDPYAACAAMESDAERLACFDATHANQSVVIAEQAVEARQEREEIFGFRALDDEIERAAAADAAVTATVSEVLQGARRSQVLLFDNGQFWREISGSTLRNRVREGWVGTIGRHWSGAYEIRFEGRSGFLRVERIQ
jgi:hypothetical protein